MLTDLQNENPQIARVVAAQQLLFATSPRVLCESIGLNWWAALKLHEAGWLSFNPAENVRLDEAQEAELRFVGSLVLAGCDHGMLNSLLSGLSKPYAYHANRLYYDWVARQWRLLPDRRENEEATFAEWLDSLVQREDVGSLAGIVELANDALSRVRSAGTQQEFYRRA